jgi:hypothetical protein
MSKLIRRLRWLLGYKPLQIPTAVPRRRECIRQEWMRMPVPGGDVIKTWRFFYSDGHCDVLTMRSKR